MLGVNTFYILCFKFMKKKISFQFNKEKIIYIYIYIISQSLEKIQLDFKYIFCILDISERKFEFLLF